MTGALVLSEGQVFAGDFEIVRELGRGGMGAVYVARQLSTGKERALKLMHSALVTDAKSRERFLLEAHVGAKIESDHVVEVIAAGVDETRGTPWLAMELLDGETLEDAVRRGPLEFERALVIFEQLCHALGAAHHASLVHRDIKPDNVYLAVSRSPGVPVRVKLLDFGIAKVLGPRAAGATDTAAVGTPLFMAPEQTSAGDIDARADVWALGLLAFHALTGRHYWRTAHDAEAPLTGLLVEMMVDPIEPASVRARQYGVELPQAFDPWFARCVDRDRTRRFADAEQAYAELARALEHARIVLSATLPNTTPLALPPTRPAPAETTAGSTEDAPTPARPSQRPSLLPWLITLAAVVGALALVGGVLLGREETRPAPTRPEPAESVGLPLQALEPRPETPEPVTPEPVTPEPEAPVAETTPEPEPEDTMAATPATPRAPSWRPTRLSARDERLRASIELSARRTCRTWLVLQPQRRVVVRVSHPVTADGQLGRWTVRPNDDELKQCLAQAMNSRWESTGAARVVRFRIVLER